MKRFKKGPLKFSYGFRQFSYEERPRRMKLTTLNDRRTRGNIIEMYKVVNEHEQIGWVNFLKLRSNLEIIRHAIGVRDSSRRIRRESFKSKFRNKSNNFSYSFTVRHNFFLNRTASIWKELPEIVVSSYGCFIL